ncbi:spermatogenesis-associated protein 31E1-like [Mustela lutreola]|uniref:spermatogenesis-associated protein 31E1-like n=1 Tax=Mustela lutreola TaxID=9666 RepID=UPI0027971C37|nr:spermatogenesis-associated protein 31E1-like [Mustela lutreola]
MSSSIAVASYSSLTTSWLAEPFLPRDGFPHQPLALPPSPPCLPPSEASPGPLTASLAPERPDTPLTLPQCDSRAPLPCPIPQSSAPHTPWSADRSASPVPAISGLARSHCPISALSCWQAAANAWNLSTSTRLESRQAPLSHGPPEALFWGDPTHKQEETKIPPSINPDVQKILEILTAKRKQLKSWREKDKKERSKYQLTSFGRMFKSPGDGQDTMGRPSFWSMRGKAKQLLGPEKPPHPKIPRDNLEQKCLQLFWGLPFLHSESLVATLRVTDPPLEFPSVIFNELSHALPLQIQGNVTLSLSLTHDLNHPSAGPQPLPLTQPLPQPLPLTQPQPLPLDQPLPQPLPLTQPQLPPLTQPQTQAHLAPSVPVGSLSLSPEMGSCEVSCPVAEKTPFYMPNDFQNLECHFLEKQLERGKEPPVAKRSRQVFSQGPPDLLQGGQAPEGHGSVSVLPGELIHSELWEQPDCHLWKRLMKQGRGPPCRIQLSLKTEPHQEFQKVPQAHSWHSPMAEPESTDGSCHATQKTGTRYPGRTVPGKRLGKDSRSSAGRIRKDLHRGSMSSPEKAPGRNRDESHTDLKPTTSSTVEKHPEKDLRDHFRKLGQFREGQMPLDVHPSRLAAHHALDHPGKPCPHGKPGKPVLSKCWEPSHDFSILSPYAQRMLEAHIMRLRVKHWWGLPLKVLKTINLFKLKGFILSQSFPSRSATCISKAGLGTKFRGNPPQPYQGQVMKESYPAWGGPLSAPQPTCKEIQQALEGTSPGGGPLARQGPRPPSRTFTYSFVGRIWHNETASRTLMNSNLESNPSPGSATKEPRRVNGGRASRDVTMLEVNLEPQNLSAKEPGEVGEFKEDPAWGVTLEPRVLANNQGLRGKLRSGSSGKSDIPLQHTKLVVRDPKELRLEAQCRVSEPRKLMESENWPRDATPTVLLQDYETGVLLQDCATESLFQDCQSNMFLAADILASQGSLSGFQSRSSEDTSTSEVLHGQRSREQSPHRQLGPLGLQHQCKSLRKSCVPREERESSRRSPLREPAKGLSEMKLLQISEVRRPAQSKEAGEASGSKACEILLKKEEAPPENYFRRRMMHLLQWFFPSRRRGLEDSLQKGKASSSQGWGQVMGRSAMDSASAEAQVVVRAVRRILEEKVLPYQGLRVPEVSWCKKDVQASADPDVCYQRVLSYQEQRRVMRDTVSPQGTPRGQNYANKTKWIGWPFPTRVPECPSRPCQNGSLVPGPSGRTLRAHYPRHCLLKKDSSPGQRLCASNAFPGRTTFLQEKTQTVQRKTFFSHISTSSMG